MRRRVSQCLPGDLGIAVTPEDAIFSWDVYVDNEATKGKYGWTSSGEEISKVNVVGMIVEVLGKGAVWVPEIKRYVLGIPSRFIELCADTQKRVKYFKC